MPNEEITTKEAAALLNVSQRTIARIIASGRLSVRIINPWAQRPIFRVPRKEVEQLRRKQQTGPLKLPQS